MSATSRVILCLLLSVAAVAVAEGRCANEVVARIESPNGRLTAVVFVRACGEPARFSTQVSLIKSAKPLPDVAGNVFQCGGIHRAGSTGAATPPVSVAWERDDLLIVRHPAGADLLSARTKVKQVLVRYRPVETKAE